VTETGDTVALFATTTSSSQNSNQPYSNSSQPVTIREPLQKALNDLFHTFTVIAGRDGEVSQQTHFVCKFLQFVVCCGRDRTRLVLHGMPTTLVSEELFTMDDKMKDDDVGHVA
jgi:mediator of RNA polymerase II transcription subunit 24